MRLDRRRLEAAHFKYAVLKVMKRYPDTFQQQKISVTLADTLKKVTQDFYTAFTTRYSGKNSSKIM